MTKKMLDEVVVKNSVKGLVISNKITREQRTQDRQAMLGETEVLGVFRYSFPTSLNILLSPSVWAGSAVIG
jgi:hypothetical protein